MERKIMQGVEEILDNLLPLGVLTILGFVALSTCASRGREINELKKIEDYNWKQTQILISEARHLASGDDYILTPAEERNMGEALGLRYVMRPGQELSLERSDRHIESQYDSIVDIRKGDEARAILKGTGMEDEFIGYISTKQLQDYISSNE